MSLDFVIGSDVIRNGMYVEIQDGDKAIGELFCPFERQEVFVTLWTERVPLEALERAAQIVRERQLMGR